MPEGTEILRQNRVLSWLEPAATFIAAVSLAIVALLTAAAIILRAVGHNLPDALELASLFMAVAVFWGMVSAALRDEFIKVDLIVLLLGPRRATVLRYVSGVITSGFLIVLARAGYDQLILTLHSGEVTPELRLPLWPFIGLSLSGLFLTAVAAVALLRPGAARSDTSKPDIPGAEISNGE